MKVFKFVLFIVIMIAAAIFYIFYTASGHAQISSKVSTLLSKELGQEVRLTIEDIAFTPSHIDVTFLINDALRAEVEGFMSPLDKEYVIKYHLSGDKILFKGVNLEDKVDISGRLQGLKDDFKLQGQGSALDGEVDFSLHHQPKKDEDIKLSFQNLNTAKLFELLEKKPLLGGTFSLEADVSLYSEFEKRGDIKLDIHRSGVYLQNVRADYEVLLPDDFMISSAGTIHLSPGQFTFDGRIDTTAANLVLKKGRYSEANQKLNALYHLEIDELSKLRFLTKKRYAGKFESDGELEYLDGLRFDGESNSMDGKMSYYYEEGKLEAKLEELSMEKMFRAMAYPSIMIGDISGKVEVDVHDNSAVINLRSKNLRFKRSSVIDNIYRVSSMDISRELFQKTYFTSSVENGVVFYDFKAENRGSHIALFDAQMDSHRNTIETNFDIKMQGEELSGEIYGSLQSPKVKLDMGKYIEFKAKKEIDEFFGMGTSDKVKKELNNVDMDDIKGFINGFF